MKHTLAFFLGIFLFVPLSAYAAEGVLFFTPEHGAYPIDSEFEIEVRANTDGQSAFAAEADISFNPQSLAVQSISTDGSVLQLWPTPPEFSNTQGTIRFSGTGKTSFSGKDALLITVRFRAIGVTAADMRFDSGAILENNARAMNIITSMRSALLTITPRQAAPLPAVAEAPTSTPSETPEVKGAAIQIPTISGYDDRIAVGERIVLYGSAAPNSEVTVFLQHDDETPVERVVQTTRDGTFTYVAQDRAAVGMYRAWAEARTASERLTSDAVAISVRSGGYAAAAESMVPILGLAILFLIALTAAGVSLGYAYNRRVTKP